MPIKTLLHRDTDYYPPPYCHGEAQGRRGGSHQTQILLFWGGSRCWAIKPTKGRDLWTCSLWNSQVFPDACLLILHKRLGCINGGSNRTYTLPCDNDIIESWQYICAGYRRQPGCAWVVCSLRKCAFNTGPVPGTELLGPLVPLMCQWLGLQRALSQKLIPKGQAGRTVRTFNLTNLRGGKRD